MSETLLSDIRLSQNPAKSTMSDGNKNRDPEVFETLFDQDKFSRQTKLAL